MYRLEILKQPLDVLVATASPHAEKDCELSAVGDQDVEETRAANLSTAVAPSIEGALQELHINASMEEASSLQQGQAASPNGTAKQSTVPDSGVHTGANSPESSNEEAKRPEPQRNYSSESTQSIPVLDEYCK